jgi:hypothetical protein
MSNSFMKFFNSLATALLLIVANTLGAQTWVAPGASGNWNVASNWSPAVVPGAGSTVIFNGTSNANCVINVNVTVANIQITAGYTGTISNSAFNIVTGTFSQAGGTFSGGTGNIGVNGLWTLSGGTFNSTSNTMTVTQGPFTLSGGSFNNNNGTVIFIDGSSCSPPAANNVIITGNITFYRLGYVTVASASCGPIF